MRLAKFKKLEEILQETILQLEASEPSDWAALSPCEVAEMLRKEIAALKKCGKPNQPVVLESLYAPTAEIQEISIANGWTKKYLILSSEFDDAMLKHKLLDY